MTNKISDGNMDEMTNKMGDITADMGQEWLGYFLQMLTAERGLAVATLNAYRDDVNSFLIYIQRRGQKTAAVAVHDLADYMQWLARGGEGADDGGDKKQQKKGLTASSRARKLSAIKQFYEFLWREGFVPANPAAKMAGPTVPRPLPKTLSLIELQQLLAALGDLDKKEGVRLCAMVELLYATGLRVSEMLTLPLAAVMVVMANQTDQENAVKVMGKGGRERWVLLNQAARIALDNYLAVRDHFLARGRPSPFLFPSGGQRGAVSRSGHVTRQALGQWLKQLARAAGLPEKKISPHVLRHAFACHLLAGGADIRSLQALLGHSNIATTEIYTHLELAQKKKLVFDKHPLAQRHHQDKP